MMSLPSLLVPTFLALLSTAAAVPAGRMSSNWPATAPDPQHPSRLLRRSRSATPLLVAQHVGSLELSPSGVRLDPLDSILADRRRSKMYGKGLSILLPAPEPTHSSSGSSSSSSSSSRRQELESLRKRVSAKLMSESSPRQVFRARQILPARQVLARVARGLQKRIGYSLCDMLGFPVSGGGCLGRSQVVDRPKTRSGSTDQARDWPSMYLLGGAIGR